MAALLHYAPLFIILALGVLMIILILTEIFRMDVTALLILVLLGVTRLIPDDELYKGFSSNAVISMIGVMIIAAGLERTGWVNILANLALSISRDRPKRLLWTLSLISGFISAFLRSIGGFAMLLPIISRVSIYMRIPKQQLMMPIGFAAIIGGTITLLGSGSLLVLNDLIAHGYGMSSNGVNIQAVGMFTVFPLGCCILIAVILFFSLFGNKLLQGHHAEQFKTGADVHQFRKIYGLGGRFYEGRIQSLSRLVGLTLSDLESLFQESHIAILGVSKGKGISLPALRRIQIEAGHRIALVGEADAIQAIAEQYDIKIMPRLQVFADILNPMRSGFSELVILPGSPLVGEPMNSLHMRRNHGVQVLSLYRKTPLYGKEMQSLCIQPGDTLGIFSEWTQLAKLEKSSEFVVVTTDYPKDVYKDHKRWQALFSLCLAIASIFLAGLPPATGLMIGAVSILVLRVVEIDEAYQAVSWKTVILIASLIPFGYAMTSTGAANFMVQIFLDTLGGKISPTVGLWLMAILGSLLSMLLSNVGATVVLVPIALHLAVAVGGDPKLYALVTTISTSNSFLIPTHQVNALITGPGGYSTKDFIYIGSFVSAIYLVVLVVAAPYFI